MDQMALLLVLEVVEVYPFLPVLEQQLQPKEDSEQMVKLKLHTHQRFLVFQ
jgi:hypothetical protein